MVKRNAGDLLFALREQEFRFTDTARGDSVLILEINEFQRHRQRATCVLIHR